jgi:hypothetical protein
LGIGQIIIGADTSSFSITLLIGQEFPDPVVLNNTLKNVLRAAAKNRSKVKTRFRSDKMKGCIHPKVYVPFRASLIVKEPAP